MCPPIVTPDTVSVLVKDAVITSPAFARVVIALLDASVIEPITGAMVSNVNVFEVDTPLALPATSVATAVTVIVPSCRRVPELPISAAAKTTGTGVVPLPVTVFVTVFP